MRANRGSWHCGSSLLGSGCPDFEGGASSDQSQQRHECARQLAARAAVGQGDVPRSPVGKTPNLTKGLLKAAYFMSFFFGLRIFWGYFLGFFWELSKKVMLSF